MRKNILSILIVTMAFNLFGCDVNDKESQSVMVDKSKVVKISSLPLIENTILSLSPTFGGKRNDIIMQQVCALAKMDQTQAQFNKFFADKGISLDKLAGEDSGFNLLANGDIKQKQLACMAYTTSYVFTPLSVEKITDKGTSESVKIDNFLLTKELSERLHVMNTNAIFFSIIAEKLESKSSDNIEQYKQRIIDIATKLSPVYFDIMSNNQIGKQHYTLSKINDGQLDFSSDGGYVYSQKNNVVTLKLENINWYGDDELLGKKHFISLGNI